VGVLSINRTTHIAFRKTVLGRFPWFTWEKQGGEERENVGAPTFKVTLEGNYSSNTGTTCYLQLVRIQHLQRKHSK
jgi:hypothetical protein